MKYSIIYSKRRTLCLQIKDDLSLVVRCPYKTSDETVSKFVKSHEGWILEKIEYLKRKNELYTTEKSVDELKASLRALITEQIEHFSKIMGVSPVSVSINSAKKRFGSCSSSGSLNFSYRLAFYPHEAIDYVVVHELAHLKEMNHSRAFWAIVEGVLPDYKSRRALLK